MNAEIQQPEPQARRRAAVIFGIGAVVGVICLYGAVASRPAIERWVTEPAAITNQAARLKAVIAVVAVAMALPLVGFAAYLWHLATRVLRDERFPPVNLSIMRPTPVLTGPDARRRGRMIQIIGVMLAILAVGVGIVLWRLSLLLTLPSG